MNNKNYLKSVTSLLTLALKFKNFCRRCHVCITSFTAMYGWILFYYSSRNLAFMHKINKDILYDLYTSLTYERHYKIIKMYLREVEACRKSWLIENWSCGCHGQHQECWAVSDDGVEESRHRNSCWELEKDLEAAWRYAAVSVVPYLFPPSSDLPFSTSRNFVPQPL